MARNKHCSRSTRTQGRDARLVLPLSVAFALGGCGPPVEEPEVEPQRIEQDVTGGLSQHHDYCDGQQWQLIERLWNIGKVVVQRPEFADCVRQSDYLACDNDPFPMTSAGSVVGEEYAIVASYSPNRLRVECRVSDEWNGRVTSGNIEEPFFEGYETLTLAKQMLDQYVAGWIGDAGYPAGVLWHEIMHTHGFRHGNDDDISARAEECGYSPDAWSYYTNSMPKIVQACVQRGFGSVVSELFTRWLARSPTHAEQEHYYALLADGSLSSPEELLHAIDHVPAEYVDLVID